MSGRAETSSVVEAWAVGEESICRLRLSYTRMYLLRMIYFPADLHVFWASPEKPLIRFSLSSPGLCGVGYGVAGAGQV